MCVECWDSCDCSFVSVVGYKLSSVVAYFVSETAAWLLCQL